MSAGQQGILISLTYLGRRPPRTQVGLGQTPFWSAHALPQIKRRVVNFVPQGCPRHIRDSLVAYPHYSTHCWFSYSMPKIDLHAQLCSLVAAEPLLASEK